MDFEEYLGVDVFYAIWQTIARHIGGQNLASIRAVSRVARKAVDDAVAAITVQCDGMHGTLPRHERFPACKHYTFIDPSEDLPQYVRQHCGPHANQTCAAVCGEACWKAPHLREWS